MQNLIDVTVVKTQKELLHVALNLWYGEPHSRPVRQPCQVMIHVLEDHVNAPLVLISLNWLPLLISLWPW